MSADRTLGSFDSKAQLATEMIYGFEFYESIEFVLRRQLVEFPEPKRTHRLSKHAFLKCLFETTPASLVGDTADR